MKYLAILTAISLLTTFTRSQTYNEANRCMIDHVLHKYSVMSNTSTKVTVKNMIDLIDAITSAYHNSSTRNLPVRLRRNTTDLDVHSAHQIGNVKCNKPETEELLHQVFIQRHRFIIYYYIMK